ncbi:inovirus-type Gp2 protein [Psychrobacter sp. 16-MNA-CIBAN-0192]|uniref:YagK/YfjJ domain-containing protein n=1 Tax=Psychrobacter sp. 16-MNA-CIBAN-0192 TaxID=3140448 RepID=UPI00331B1ECA
MSYQTQTINQLLTAVDKIVDDILNDKHNSIDPYEIALDLNELYPAMMHHHRSTLVYTETIKWFVATGQKLKGEYYPSEIKWNDESAQQFIDEIKIYLPEYHLNKASFALKEDRNTKSLTTYLNDLTEHYGRLLFVRVDLHYRMDGIGEDSIDNFNEHMKVLLKRIEKTNGCFKDLHGYAWALEQGYKNDCGLHCHLLLMYDASKHHKGSYFGQAVGEKWVSIIKGQGHYFNASNPNHVKGFATLGKRGV